MRLRIEEADPLTLLRELPERWAQTCVTRPPTGGDPDRTLQTLTEVRRVLRQDGTLWVLPNHEQPRLADELGDGGWTQQAKPGWARDACRDVYCVGTRLLLFTNGPRYFFAADSIAARSRSPRPQCPSGSARRVLCAQSCVRVRERERRLQLVKRCIEAASSLVACGQCGAPYTRARPGERSPGTRRPTCPHNNPGGCCLVLDPFYDARVLPTGQAALSAGRSFLGITSPAGEGAHR